MSRESRSVRNSLPPHPGCGRGGPHVFRASVSARAVFSYGTGGVAVGTQGKRANARQSLNRTFVFFVWTSYEPLTRPCQWLMLHCGKVASAQPELRQQHWLTSVRFSHAGSKIRNRLPLETSRKTPASHMLALISDTWTWCL